MLMIDQNKVNCLDSKKIRMGLVIYYDFHKENKWTNATTYHLIQGIIDSYDCVFIQNQADYENALGEIDFLLSMEPDFAGPVLNYVPNKRCRELFSQIPSYVLLSDFHARKWRMDYVLDNGFDYVLSYYYHPFLHHFNKIDPKKMVHFPWTVPDHWFDGSGVEYHGDKHICCFGGKNSPAYELRNWCRQFDFVRSSDNSGCENVVYSPEEFVGWMRRNDAMVAAGSEDIEYRLTTPKYFEIAAVGSLLFAQETDDLEMLGFRHMENCVVFNKSNFERLGREYLANPGGYLHIRKKGMELVNRHHRKSIRVKFLQNHVQQAIIQKKNQKIEVGRVGCPEEKKGDSMMKKTNDIFNGTDLREALERRKAGESTGRKEVLFIVDEPGWAHDFKTDNIKKYLGDEFDVRKVYQKDLKAADIERAELVVVYYWSQFIRPEMMEFAELFIRNKHKVLLGICSHREMRDEVRQDAFKIINNFCSGVFVNNLLLFEEFNGQFDMPVFYTPNGVDTDFFRPVSNKERGGKLRVGWAGSLKNHGAVRGYDEFIVPACNAVEGVELVVAAREDKWRSHREMVKFYNSIDVYLCASLAEGTPNPCLEAAACGVPVVTTKVGNMPEFIRHGVNGYFVEREVKDIVSKLEILSRNRGLLEFMSENIRKDIVEWDWSVKSRNYRYMLEAAVSSADGTENLFKSQSQVYLASADRMDKVINNALALFQMPDRNVDTYATVVGGLSGLNYLLALNPKRIVFYDINVSAICYARLIVELINMCDCNKDFISHVFCRSVEKFEANEGKLDVSNQVKYLQMPISQDLLRDTISKLSAGSRRVFEDYVIPHLVKEVLDGVRNCRRLVPCFPIDERVPVGGGLDKGRNQHGQDVPNTNSFFYGYGWLENVDTFGHIKSILQRAELSFVNMDILSQDIDPIFDMSGSMVLHASNIDDWFGDKWVEFVNMMVTRSLERQGHITFVTTNGSVMSPDIESHDKAYKAIEPYVYGDVVEVTHKVPWGFHEFKRRNVLYSDYLKQDCHADTTILHILSGEGLGSEALKQVLAKAMVVSKRVIVMEHNKDSADWAANDSSNIMGSKQLCEMILPMFKEHGFDLTGIVDVAGKNDLKRNIMFVGDTSQKREKASGPQSGVELSVVITAYNRQDMLGGVLEGFVNQSIDKDRFEVVVVDDGSEPSLESVVKRFEGELKLVYVRQKNSGLAAARNRGIEAASGEIVLFSDDDDIPSTELVSEHLRSHRENPDDNIAVLGHIEWSHDIQVTPMMYYITGPGGEYLGYDSMQDGQFYNVWKWWGGLISAKRSLLASVEGPFDERIRFGYEDTELACRLIDRNVKILYNAEAKSYIVRPIDFEEFCNRRYKQGKALYYVARKHPEIIVQRYGLENAEQVFHEKLAMLEEWEKEVPEIESILNSNSNHGNSDGYLERLYDLYRVCFIGEWLKGYLDQKRLVEEGVVSLNDDVNVEEVSCKENSKTDYNQAVILPEDRDLDITIISSCTPGYDIGSSNLRIYQLLKIMEAKGYRVNYLYFSEYPKDEQYKAAFGDNVKFVRVAPEGKAFVEYFQSVRNSQIDYVWITNIWGVDYLLFVQRLQDWLKVNRSGCKIIVDTMDFHFKKYIRKYEISGSSEDIETANQFLELEKVVYPAAYKTVVVTENEKSDIIENVGSDCSVSVLANIHRMMDIIVPEHQRKHLCFLGSFNINHNKDAVLWFLDKVWPAIHKQKPDLEFHILGFNNERYVDLVSHYANVKVVGYVEDADAAVSQYSVFVCPMVYGAGMKGKLGIAGATGTPFVTTSIGAEGFELVDGQNCFIADDASEFADKCIRLIEDNTLWSKFSEAVYRTIGDCCSIRKTSGILTDVLSGVNLLEDKGRSAGSAGSVKSSSRAASKCKKPKVTVVTSCYNCQRFFYESIESVRAQTLQDWELILIDDASTDQTREMIEWYSKIDKRIKVFTFDDNLGPYVRRNFAIKQACSDYIVIHDADDIMAANKLERLYKEITSEENAGIVGSFYYTFYEEFVSAVYSDRYVFPTDHDEILDSLYKWQHVVSLGSSIIRKSFFDVIGYFDSNRIAADRFWFAKAGLYVKYCSGIKFKNVPSFLTFLRMHDTSQTQTDSIYDPRNKRERYKDYCRYKLVEIEKKYLADMTIDLAKEIYQCECSDFAELYVSDSANCQNIELDESLLYEMNERAVLMFNHNQYVSCIDTLNNIEKLYKGVSKRFRNFNFLRAMSMLSIQCRQKGIDHLARELHDHDNPAVEKFMRDYFGHNIKNSIVDWCMENSDKYDLEIIDISKGSYNNSSDNQYVQQVLQK